MSRRCPFSRQQHPDLAGDPEAVCALSSCVYTGRGPGSLGVAKGRPRGRADGLYGAPGPGRWRQRRASSRPPSAAPPYRALRS